MSRGLLTEGEREALRKGPEHPDISRDYYNQVRYLVRKRVREELGEDLDVLEEEMPEVFRLVDGLVNREAVVPVELEARWK